MILFSLKINEVMFKVEYEFLIFYFVRERINIVFMGLIIYFFYIIDFFKFCICYKINVNKEVIELEYFCVFGFWFF